MNNEQNQHDCTNRTCDAPASFEVTSTSPTGDFDDITQWVCFDHVGELLCAAARVFGKPDKSLFWSVRLMSEHEQSMSSDAMGHDYE